MIGFVCYNLVGKRYNVLFLILNFKVEFRWKKEFLGQIIINKYDIM